MRFRNNKWEVRSRNLEMKNRVWTVIKKLILVYVLLLTSYFLLPTSSHSEVLDRIVAIVDDEVVMFSEFNEAFQRALNSGIEVTQEEVLNGLINRVLLLKQAKKYHREHIFAARTREDGNVLINEYIEKRIKAFIRIPFDEIELFYGENKEFFSPQDENNFYDVRDEIEVYLREDELNKRLIRHIEELREKAYIRIQLRSKNRR
jgi:hypothetical protein